MQNRNIIIGSIVILVLIIGIIWYAGNRTPADPQRIEIPGDPEQVVNEEQRIEFTYFGGEEGYTLLESSPGTDFGDPQLVKAYTLVDTTSYNENNQNAVGLGNEIPTISILVFNEPEEATTTPAAPAATTSTSTPTVAGPTLAEWAEDHSGFTAYGLRQGEPEDVTLDGTQAIRYRANGPFASEVYVVDYRDKYYVILGQYENEDSEIRAAFEKLLTDIFFL